MTLWYDLTAKEKKVPLVVEWISKVSAIELFILHKLSNLKWGQKRGDNFNLPRILFYSESISIETLLDIIPNFFF